MTALQAGAPWRFAGPRRWVWRTRPLLPGRAEPQRGLSRAARCAALIAALTWAVTLTPAVEAQQAASLVPTGRVAVTVAAAGDGHLAGLDLGLHTILDDLRAGRLATEARAMVPGSTAVESTPAFSSYPAIQPTAIAFSAVTLTEHLLVPHLAPHANAFAIPLADAAAVVPAQPAIIRVPAPAASLGPAPVNHFPAPAPPPTRPGVVAGPGVVPGPGGDSGPGGPDGRMDPPLERPSVIVPGEESVDPTPSDEDAGDGHHEAPEAGAAEPDRPDASVTPPEDPASEPTPGPAPLAPLSQPVPDPVPEAPVSPPMPDPVPEAPVSQPAPGSAPAAPPTQPAPDPAPSAPDPAAAVAAPSATPPTIAATQEQLVAWLQHRLGVVHDPVPADPSDPQQLVLWTELLEICAPGGAGRVAACIDANRELFGGRPG